MVSHFGVLTTALFILFLEGFPSGILAQMISDTLINGNYACQGSEVTFTCVTRGSPGISWISDKFIGTGRVELGFSAESNDPGQTRHSNSVPTTVATLTEEYDDGGVQVLTSTLQIIATAGSLTPSVTCRDELTGVTDTVNFQLLGEPIEPENVLPVQISHHNNSCAVLVVWRTNEDSNMRNLTRYSVYRNDELMTSDAVPINDTWMSSLFSVPCGPHSISVSATNRCGESIRSRNIELSSKIHHNLTVNVSTAECSAPTDAFMNSDAAMGNNACPTEPPRSDITLPVIIAVILAVVYIVLVVIIVVLIYELKKQKRKTGDGKKNPLPTPTDDEKKVSPVDDVTKV